MTQQIVNNSLFVVGFGGSTRPGSSGERMVRGVLAEASDLGARTRMFGGTELAALPHYCPEQPTRSAEQQEFVEAVRCADGLVIGSPGYHGGVSGLVKNAIDLLEDLNNDQRVYFSDRAVGLVVVAAGWQACGCHPSGTAGHRTCHAWLANARGHCREYRGAKTV